VPAATNAELAYLNEWQLSRHVLEGKLTLVLLLKEPAGKGCAPESPLPLLVQLIQNLVGNALKFRGDHSPEVLVTAAHTGAGWQVSVRDNGIGIDPQYADRIFAIFQRLHSRAAYPGTGVGLAICKRIVARLGGRIWLESQPGAGATFHFTLPEAAAGGTPR